MNDWENDSSNKSFASDKSCRCSDMSGLFVPNRHLSFVVAGIILVVFLTFIGGYFFGQKSTAEQFTHQIHQDLFADQVYASVFSLAKRQGRDDSVPGHVAAIVTTDTQAETTSTPEEAEHIPSTRYYAQLIGFGTSRAAERFVKRLTQKGVIVQTKKRVSKTAKGRTIVWYQVVTPPYADKVELETLVFQVSKEEKLKGVRIITC